MTDSIKTVPDLKSLGECLSERAAALAAKLQLRLGSPKFKAASDESQTDVLIAGSLLTVITSSIGPIVHGLECLLPPADDSNGLADIPADMAEATLLATGIKKDAIIQSIATTGNLVLPMLEQLMSEAERRLG
ncbi:MAG: hypothetical protein SGJ27_22510 [Candidatus Melainabacteria bacterium]|mgnify:CR=1 FL=1|nr:hypothetical protein [Candidatus Melainabacteria bacterium]